MSQNSELIDAEASDATVLFSDLALPEPIQKALIERGYTEPTPIQAAIIPHVLAGQDVVGLAQTGTGKTAAFALPLLAQVDPKLRTPQVLVLAPTRELANQVADACHAYGRHLKGMSVAAVYGGAPYGDQLRSLRRGAQIVVGTPGRVMDHMERGSLDLSQLRCLVLDEADEMLRMGFIDDVEWVMERIPDQRQVALFSATMPPEIRRIAKNYLVDPVEIKIKAAPTASTVRQRYWYVRGVPKWEALSRFIEGEETDGVMVFTRTKMATVEVAQNLQEAGIAADSLNGDMGQSQRERTVEQLKNGELDVIVATDVAARGLDVPRISHVINYDMPGDAETYVHRIGRTGRAGRSGEAILFVHPREKRALWDIERRTKQQIEEMELPHAEDINSLRIRRLAERVVATQTQDLKDFEAVVTGIITEHELDPVQVAAAFAKLMHGDQPLFVKDVPAHKGRRREERRFNEDRSDRSSRADRSERRGSSREEKARRDQFDRDAVHYRIACGHVHGTKPGMIVGAIANELGISGKAIGSIQIHETHSTVSLPGDMSADMFDAFRRIRVAGQALSAERLDEAPTPRRGSGGGKPFLKRGRRDEGGRSPDRGGRRRQNRGPRHF